MRSSSDFPFPWSYSPIGITYLLLIRAFFLQFYSFWTQGTGKVSFFIISLFSLSFPLPLTLQLLFSSPSVLFFSSPSVSSLVYSFTSYSISCFLFLSSFSFSSSAPDWRQGSADRGSVSRSPASHGNIKIAETFMPRLTTSPCEGGSTDSGTSDSRYSYWSRL